MSIHECEPCNRPSGVFKGKNFMTPDVLGYWRVPGGYAELSKGAGFERGTTIYGVTCARPDGDDPGLDAYRYEGVPKDQKLSQCFHSKKEAIAYIGELVIPPRPTTPLKVDA